MSKKHTLSKIRDITSQIKKEEPIIWAYTCALLPDDPAPPSLSHGAKKMIDILAQHDAPVNQRNLAKMIGISPQATSIHVKKLEKLGYLVRTAGTQKNENMIMISETGRRFGVALDKAVILHAEHILADLSPKDVEDLMGLLERIKPF